MIIIVRFYEFHYYASFSFILINKLLISFVDIEKRLESFYIINCELQVQEETLYRLGYTTLGKYKLQF